MPLELAWGTDSWFGCYGVTAWYEVGFISKNMLNAAKKISYNMGLCQHSPKTHILDVC